jgi:F420-dependent oxidoreductase-like protein
MTVGEHQVRIGLKYLPMNTTPELLREVWTSADEAGFDHLWIFDHFRALERSATGWYQCPPTDPVFEAWTTLAAMAVLTKRIRIGINVVGNLYRHPGVVAKMAATVDHFSGGRLEVGIGAGWAERELVTLGMPFPAVGERIERLAEACDVLKLLWTQDFCDYAGRYYTLTQAISSPHPLQKPYPPLWLGGGGEKKTLRVVAQHADVWNIPGGAPTEAIRLSGVLDAHCEAVGRDPATIRRSVGIQFEPDDVDVALRACEELIAGGFSDLLVSVRGPDAPRQVEMAAATVLARFADPHPAG